MGLRKDARNVAKYISGPAVSSIKTFQNIWSHPLFFLFFELVCCYKWVQFKFNIVLSLLIKATITGKAANCRQELASPYAAVRCRSFAFLFHLFIILLLLPTRAHIDTNNVLVHWSPFNDVVSNPCYECTCLTILIVNSWY